MNVKELMEMCLDLPIDMHENTQVRVCFYDRDTDEPIDEEKLESLNGCYELVFRQPEDLAPDAGTS